MRYDISPGYHIVSCLRLASAAPGDRTERKATVTTEELLDFCAKREVEVYTSYNPISNNIVCMMRKRNLQLKASISSRDAAHSAGLGLTVRIVLRDMANKLDKKLAAEQSPASK